MWKKSIEKTLIQESKKIEIPDIKNEILSQLEVTEYCVTKKKSQFSFAKLWYALPAFLFLISLTCFGVMASYAIPNGEYKEYTEVKDIAKVQSVYAYQVTLLSTLVNNPTAVETEDLQINDALSDSIGFVDLVLNLNKASSKLYQCSGKEYKYYLSTNLNDLELCRFYFNEQMILGSNSLKTFVIHGYIKYKNSEFAINGESILHEDGYYTTSFMLGHDNAKVCLSSDEKEQDTYEYRVYNDDVICKTVSLEFKDNEIFMNVDFQNEYFKFQIQGNNNQYHGKYHTGNTTGSLMVEIENDKYNFDVDDSHSSAERYILP